MPLSCCVGFSWCDFGDWLSPVHGEVKMDPSLQLDSELGVAVFNLRGSRSVDFCM